MDKAIASALKGDLICVVCECVVLLGGGSRERKEKKKERGGGVVYLNRFVLLVCRGSQVRAARGQEIWTTGSGLV